jgi:hypothetical protein
LRFPFSVVILIMAPLLLPSGFKYRRFFSAGGPNIASMHDDILSVDGLDDAAEGSAIAATAAAREEMRRQQRDYERSRVFQDIWAAKLP